MARVGVLWLLSIVAAVAGMEVAHRLVLEADRSATAQTTEGSVVAGRALSRR